MRLSRRIEPARTRGARHKNVLVRLWAVLCLALLMVQARTTAAEDATVPIALQAELLSKVAPYDKNLAPRAHDRVRILLLTRAGSDDSMRATAQMRSALAGIDRIGGLPHDEVVFPFTTREALTLLVREQHASIVFLTPGLSDSVESIRAALDGGDVLSASAIPSDVPKGIVLGFDLVSGKPKLLVNLTQMRRQNVAFGASVLKLMRVYEQ